MGDLKKRLLSAFLFGPLIVILFLILPPKFFLLLVALVLILAVYELSIMSRAAGPYMITVFAVLGLVPLYAGPAAAYPLWLLFSSALYLVCTIAMQSRIKASAPDMQSVNRNIALALSVLLASEVFLVLPLFYLYRLKEAAYYLPLVLLLIIWASDTAAYLLGKTMGRHKLVPLISPKKTYEGLVGAMLGAMLVTLLFHNIMEIGIPEGLVLGALIGILGQLGDILESIGKRVWDVKDSSALIPGHGGILDRVDSFLLTTPFVYHYLTGFKG